LHRGTLPQPGLSGEFLKNGSKKNV
jgi:hypothetical protein